MAMKQIGSFLARVFRRSPSHIERHIQTICRREVGYMQLRQVCRRFVQPVVQPLVLVSEVQRSGGTLLSQLFDGHPEIHAHPHELKIGFPHKSVWPEFCADSDLKKTFLRLFEPKMVKLSQEGYTKGRGHRNAKVFRFLFVPEIQWDVFRECMEVDGDSANERAILNAYMTSYFNAWLDNQNLYGEKKVITGFVAEMANDIGNVSRFFRAYPDGYLISVLRDPLSWYASARRHWPSESIEQILDRWLRSAAAMVENHRTHPQKVLILRFEDLIRCTSETMKVVARFIGVGYEPILTTPTFNSQPIEANSSYEVSRAGLIDAPLNRANELDTQIRRQIELVTSESYRNALAVASHLPTLKSIRATG